MLIRRAAGHALLTLMTRRADRRPKGTERPFSLTTHFIVCNIKIDSLETEQYDIIFRFMFRN